MHHQGDLASANFAFSTAVMSERSSSGVRNIRAMFEAKNESISPPSRGRSPVGSEGARSTSSRPLSKVRTSFVAVELSGQMGPQLGLRKPSSSGDGDFGLDGSNDPKMGVSDTNLDHRENPKANGNGGIDPAHSVATIEEVKEEDVSNVPKEDVHDEKETIASSGSAETTQEQQKSLISSSPKNRRPAEELDNLASNPSNGATDDLGSVLKGSPFDLSPTEEKNSTNNTPEGTKTTNKKVPSAIKAKPVTTGGTPTKTHLTSRPLPIRTKREADEAQKGSASKTSAKPARTPMAPHTPKTPSTSGSQSQTKTSSTRQSLPKTSSPRLPLSSNTSTKAISKVPTETIAKKPSQKSLTSNATAEPKSRQPSSTSGAPKANTKSTTSSSSKTQPKSPTRPVRLPTSATASTAASVAKLGGAPPSRSPSRAGATGTNLGRKPSTLNKDRQIPKPRAPLNGTASHLHKKTSRPSLPATERPKSRTGTSGKPLAAEESFLTRMTRPTASSASKVHEKIETKSPPRKIPTKSKRKSEIGEGNSKLAGESVPAQTLVEEQEDERPPGTQALTDENTVVVNGNSENAEGITS